MMTMMVGVVAVEVEVVVVMTVLLMKVPLTMVAQWS